MHAWNPMCSGANVGTWFGRCQLINFFPSCIYTCIYVYIYISSLFWLPWALMGQALMGRALMGRALMGQALMGRALIGLALMRPPGMCQGVMTCFAVVGQGADYVLFYGTPACFNQCTLPSQASCHKRYVYI